MSAKRQPSFAIWPSASRAACCSLRRSGRGYAKVLIESLAPTEAAGKREQHANRQILQVTNATLKALRKLDNAICTALPSPTKGRYAISRAAHRPGGLNTSAHSPETSESPSLYP